MRDATGATPTDFGFTGQRRDASTGLMYYRARYYDSTLGRFVSADTIVPGSASGAGGGVTTLGYDRNTRLTPLTVNLGEFAEQIGAENREVLQFGAFFQWDSETRQEHNVPMGPANPQALNRYAYVLNNPLRYVDPTGHSEYVWHFTTTPEELGHYIVLLENMKSSVEQFAAGFALAGVVAGAIGGPAGWVFGVGCEVIAGYHALTNAEFEDVINYLEQAQLTSTSDTIHIGVFFDEFGIPYVKVNNGVEANYAQAMLLSGEFFYNVFAHPERYTDVGTPPGDDTEWLVKEWWPVPWRQE